MEVLNQLLGFTENNTVRAILVLAAVILLIIVLGFLMRRFTRRGAGHKRGRVARLSIIEAIAVDQRRRLVLVRRDNTEHLLMIGGASDILIEEKIQRVARPSGAQRPLGERVDTRTAVRPRTTGKATSADIPQRRPAGPAVAQPAAATAAPAAASTASPTPTKAPPQAPATAPVFTTNAPQAAPTPTPLAAPVAPIRPTPKATPVTDMKVSTPPTSAPSISTPKTAQTPAVAAPVSQFSPLSSAPDSSTPETPAPEPSGKERQLAEMERQLENALRGSVAENPTPGPQPTTGSAAPQADAEPQNDTGQPEQDPGETADQTEPDSEAPDTQLNATEKTGS